MTDPTDNNPPGAKLSKAWLLSHKKEIYAAIKNFKPTQVTEAKRNEIIEIGGHEFVRAYLYYLVEYLEIQGLFKKI